MDPSEKFCLRWNDFETNISGAFRELKEDKDFFDVTLACEDEQLQAHKVILSACSPFFRTILRRNRHEHPLLYLKGVKYAYMASVLNFMYHGEVNVAQEELNSFLAVAEDLKVKGLTENISETKPKKASSGVKPHPQKTHPLDPPSQPNNIPPPKRSQPAPLPQVPKAPLHTNYIQENEEIQEVVPVKAEPFPEQTETSTNQYNMVEQEQAYPETNQQYKEGILAHPDMQYGEEYTDYGGYEAEEGGYENTGGLGMQDGNKALDDLIAKSMSLIVDESGSRVWTCHLCNRTNKHKSDIRRHMEIHLEIQNQCPHCEKQVQTREALRKHIYRYHKF